ncbi:quinone oxidoreductase [Hortaea werneckii]|nr:quinone oxidoreductase [Hortaea werneckii]
MKAIAVKEYGAIDNLVSLEIDKPDMPQGHDILVRRMPAGSDRDSILQVRAGTYDDYPDYYQRAPPLPQIIGFDVAGVVEDVGDHVKNVSPGDEVYYSGSPIRPGSNAEYQLVDSRSVAHKPKSLNFVQAASMPLTWITAWEAIIERMGMIEGEQSGILIINGSGGIGSVASQIARFILKLPVIVTTTSREQTTTFSKEMGATHTVNHREDVVKQIKDLQLDYPINYVFITHTPASKYIVDSAAICAPFGKVCSIVQDKEIPMYGTEWMAKSLTYVWELIGTKPVYELDVDSHGKILEQLTEMLDSGQVKCHHQQTLPLTVEGLRRAHEQIEAAGAMGKVGLSVEACEEGRAFS